MPEVKETTETNTPASENTVPANDNTIPSFEDLFGSPETGPTRGLFDDDPVVEAEPEKEATQEKSQETVEEKPAEETETENTQPETAEQGSAQKTEIADEWGVLEPVKDDVLKMGNALFEGDAQTFFEALDANPGFKAQLIKAVLEARGEHFVAAKHGIALDKLAERLQGKAAPVTPDEKMEAVLKGIPTDQRESILALYGENKQLLEEKTALQGQIASQRETVVSAYMDMASAEFGNFSGQLIASTLKEIAPTAKPEVYRSVLLEFKGASGEDEKLIGFTAAMENIHKQKVEAHFSNTASDQSLARLDRLEEVTRLKYQQRVREILVECLSTRNITVEKPKGDDTVVEDTKKTETVTAPKEKDYAKMTPQQAAAAIVAEVQQDLIKAGRYSTRG